VWQAMRVIIFRRWVDRKVDRAFVVNNDPNRRRR